ncbi:hypothetical protein [Pedobacter rhizosphaerae]|uniref:Uncharacterized protein n=1 Tax=Pedobacter rhizosphaerae TaxID=390241 RepID=A0A1H9UAL5_9SPHI|nr:hypothetical protein [Pedobacter rhizosphaerae]SES06590.1 hypothetical protein SAMN04488023_12920 [Pedobacter rhizosphaerae]
MNLLEYSDALFKAQPALKLKSEYTSDYKQKIYSNVNIFRKTIEGLEEVTPLKPVLEKLKKTAIFASTGDTVTTTSSSEVEDILTDLKSKINLLNEMIHASKLFGREDLLYVKLPEFKSFDELAKFSKDLQKAIEIPITDTAINGEVNIIGADQGSVILYVALGTIAAVKLIAGICWSAAVIKKKNAEANMFVEHAKTLELKNEALDSIIEAQKKQLRNIADSEANALANGLLNHNDPETIGRLKLSMEIITNLIDKGGKILPMTKDEDIQKSFPNYNALDLIESSIRQIQPGNRNN